MFERACRWSFRMSFQASLHGCLGLLRALLIAWTMPVAVAELVYDNSANSLNIFLSRQEEYGDEVNLAGTARTLTVLEFQVVGETNLPAGATVVFRFYLNNGPFPPPPDPRIRPPGDLLYQSAAIPIRAGVQPIRIEDVLIPVPPRVSATWTVQFSGTGTQAGERAGLQVYHPPVVGSSFKDYWVRDADRFRLYVLDENNGASFAARFEAEPDPPTRVIPVSATDGMSTLRIEGPIGSDQLVEVSRDLRSWRVVGVVTLATNAAGIFMDAEAATGMARYYRARSSPYPGSTVWLKGIRREADGSAVLTLVGPANSQHLLEVSTDGNAWSPQDIIQFSTTTAEYTDPGAKDGAALRFYRTSRPSETGPLYLIRQIERRSGGAAVLSCVGSPEEFDVNVEASEDLESWLPIGLVRFTSGEAAFTDLSAASAGLRFYRLRR
jgi:hypothetical protein